VSGSIVSEREEDMLYFISDVHLGVDSPSRERYKRSLLRTFLDYVGENGTSLFILGDLFDVWFEYRTVIPSRYFTILHSLQNLLDRGIRIHYVLGNHDYWTNYSFFLSMGMVVHRRPFSIEMEGRRFYISHGDDPVGRHDIGYRTLRRIIRNRWIITAMQAVHPDIGISLARRFSKASRRHDRGGENDMNERYITHVAEPCFDRGIDFVVIGHFHTPLLREMEGKTFVNTGNWFRDFTYGRYDPRGTFFLERWSQQS
jgi:UDP-2,3-diacylglucosamine hydrolase